MNIFDVVGPIMVGPSSSHTAGAVRIGKVVSMFMNSKITNAEIKFHGSFAKSYLGHGTDKAIVAGLLGMFPDDERIRDSFAYAEKENLHFSISTIELRDAHPNTAIITARNEEGRELTIRGKSIGGGKIKIEQIDDMRVVFEAETNTIIVFHKDAKGAIAQTSQIIADGGVNIPHMDVFRNNRGGKAAMLIETDNPVTDEQKEAIKEISEVYELLSFEPEVSA